MGLVADLYRRTGRTGILRKIFFIKIIFCWKTLYINANKAPNRGPCYEK